MEYRQASGTADVIIAVPVWGDAAEAEAVSAGNGDRLGENVLTDATIKLHVCQKNAGKSHDLKTKNIYLMYQDKIN